MFLPTKLKCVLSLVPKSSINAEKQIAPKNQVKSTQILLINLKQRSNLTSLNKFQETFLTSVLKITQILENYKFLSLSENKILITVLFGKLKL